MCYSITISKPIAQLKEDSMPKEKSNPLTKLSLIFSVTVPVVALISTLSILVYKVDVGHQSSDKNFDKVFDRQDNLIERMTIVETTVKLSEPAKQQGVSK